jgi:hypothetical protein
MAKAKLSTVKVEIGIPSLGKIEGTWEPDKLEEQAAWELYIELITRTSIIELQYETGLLRESLSSLHSLFPTTRDILRRYGPAIARPKGKSVMSLGYISVTILNLVLRPFLSKWHPLLLDHEITKPTGISPIEYERNWKHYNEFRKTLRELQTTLLQYADVLAEVANIPSLVINPQEKL